MLFDEHLTLAKSGHVLPASLSPIIVVNYRGLILVSRAEMRAAQGNQGSKPEPPPQRPTARPKCKNTLSHSPKAHILIIFGHQHRRNADSNLRGNLAGYKKSHLHSSANYPEPSRSRRKWMKVKR